MEQNLAMAANTNKLTLNTVLSLQTITLFYCVKHFIVNHYFIVTISVILLTLSVVNELN